MKYISRFILAFATLVALSIPIPVRAQSLCPGGMGYCWADDNSRPGSPGVGTSGYNEFRGTLEWWTGASWVQASNYGLVLQRIDSTAKEASHQLCITNCDLYGLLVNVTGTPGATPSGNVMLFDTTSPGCPVNGAVVPAISFQLNTDGTRGSISIEFAVPRHFLNGLIACWSTAADDFTLTSGGAIASFHAGVK